MSNKQIGECEAAPAFTDPYEEIAALKAEVQKLRSALEPEARCAFEVQSKYRCDLPVGHEGDHSHTTNEGRLRLTECAPSPPATANTCAMHGQGACICLGARYWMDRALASERASQPPLQVTAAISNPDLAGTCLSCGQRAVVQKPPSDAEADAERYRWLAANCRGCHEELSHEPQLVFASPYRKDWRARLDAAIDELRSTSTKSEGQS